MAKHNFKEWMIAVRPWSFPASTMPIVVTIAYLAWKAWTGRGTLEPDGINFWMGLYAIANIIIFHAAGNTWSDYKDYKKGVDSEDTHGVHTLTSGMFKPKEIKHLSLWLLAIGSLMGIGALFLTRHLFGSWLPLLLIGFGGFLSAICYPASKYNALGDVTILLSYAFLPTIGTSFVTTGTIDWMVLIIALPLGLITDGILHTNNTRDMISDKSAHIKTLPMIMGHKTSAIWYFTELMVPYVWTGVLSMAGLMPVWTVLIFLTFPVAIANGRTMMKSLRGGLDVIKDLDVSTAQLQLMFSLLLTVSFVIAIVINICR